MVSKASEDLPDPETPVTTVRVLWGISKSMFFRLWTRAPRTTIVSDIREPPPEPVLRIAGCGPTDRFRSSAESFYYKCEKRIRAGGNESLGGCRFSSCNCYSEIGR